MSAAHERFSLGARALLGLAPNVDDATFIGAPSGSSREAIIAAARVRLTQLARDTTIAQEVREAARIEIRDAARRLVAEALAAAEERAWRTAEPSAGERSERIIFDSLATAIFMRRDPRRARMFFARMVTQSADDGSTGHQSSSTVSRGGGVDDGNFELEFDITGERTQRVPWVLGLFVVLSVLLLIAEIAYLRGIADLPSDAAAPKETADAVAPADPVTIRERIDAGIPKEFLSKPPESKSAPATVVAPTPIQSPAPSASVASDANRKLRDRWQRMARTAMDIQQVESGGNDASQHDDPLAAPLREIIILERLLALDLAARQLLSGSDDEASLLLDTLPSEATVTLPAHPLVAFSIRPQSDGELEKWLHKSTGATESRASRLRILRARAEAPGPRDARTLVQEALKGPSRTTRTIAQGVLVDRGRDSRDVLEAVEERFTEIANDPALAGMIRAFSGVDPDGVEGAAAARAAILDRILQLSGSRQPQIDRACEELAATLRRSAAQLAVTTSATDPSAVLRAMVKSTGVRLRQSVASRRSVVQSFGQDGTVLLHEEASALKVRRPADGLLIDEVVQRTALERAQATSALGQAIVNARGALALDGLRLAVPSVREASAALAQKPTSFEWGTAIDQALVTEWSARLEALSPSDAGGYFVLGEDVADANHSDASRALARQLFALAGGLNADEYAASAALALAALDDASGASGGQQWRAVAQRFSDAVAANDAPIAARDVGSAVRGCVIEAIVQYRRGFGRRAADRLKQPQVRALFESVMRAVPGGSEEFDRLAAIHLRGEGTPLDAATVDALLRVEQALLQPTSDRWAVALALGGDDAIVDAPLGSAREIFDIETGRDRWQGDRFGAAAGQ
ncbi:MAG: hypothetical protein EXS17_02830 [Phycisphaerales bacterium]|nr:hypothetical protein [Phycisphaerales bacterium]